jgi:hypothetical protein
MVGSSSEVIAATQSIGQKGRPVSISTAFFADLHRLDAPFLIIDRWRTKPLSYQVNAEISVNNDLMLLNAEPRCRVQSSMTALFPCLMDQSKANLMSAIRPEFDPDGFDAILAGAMSSKEAEHPTTGFTAMIQIGG